jgi:hypothetical protein
MYQYIMVFWWTGDWTRSGLKAIKPGGHCATPKFIHAEINLAVTRAPVLPLYETLFPGYGVAVAAARNGFAEEPNRVKNSLRPLPKDLTNS